MNSKRGVGRPVGSCKKKEDLRKMVSFRLSPEVLRILEDQVKLGRKKTDVIESAILEAHGCKK